MSVARRKGDPGRADMLFSRLVRSRMWCQRCGQQATDTAHIVKRRYSATRCLEDNAWSLCRRCHQVTEQWPGEFMALVESTIGLARYEELRRLAEAGITCSSRTFWRETVERLTERCKEESIDTRWRATA